MPLPDSGPRREIHHRQIEMRGYQREDGLYEIDGRVTDRKTYDFQPEGGQAFKKGEPLHDMWVRLVVDAELNVRDVIAVTDSHPYRQCPEASAALKSLVGLSIMKGWAKAVNERLGGEKSCSHQKELLIPLASAAFQTLTSYRLSLPTRLDAHGRPVKLNSCYAYGTDRELVLKRYPAFYTGPKPEASETPAS